MNDLHIDVEWLMENPWFQSNVTLVAGSSGLKRRVTYVTVQEAPDFYKQIEGGEFLLPRQHRGVGGGDEFGGHVGKLRVIKKGESPSTQRR